MTKQNFNFEILIRGQMLAYHQDEIVDKFTDDACFDIMHDVMGFPSNRYNGRIKVSTPDDCNPDIGYYNTQTHVHVVQSLTYKLYMQNIKGTLMDMKERIKVYDQSINALKLAKIGLFGNSGHVRSTYDELIIYRDLLQDMVDKCEHDLKYIKEYKDIPTGDERFIEMAERILMELNDVFIINEPTESDTVGNVKGEIK
jgi:hypothetical protein